MPNLQSSTLYGVTGSLLEFGNFLPLKALSSHDEKKKHIAKANCIVPQECINNRYGPSLRQASETVVSFVSKNVSVTGSVETFSVLVRVSFETFLWKQ